MGRIKILLSICAFVFGSGIVSGQGWEKIFGVPELDESGTSVVQADDGGFAITGKKGDDFFFIKTDNSGNILWEKNFGGYNIQKSQSEGFIICGAEDIIKTDNDGNIEWQENFDGENFSGIQETPDKGLIVTGRFSGGITIKLDSIRNIEWQKDFGGVDIKNTMDGGYIIGKVSYESITQFQITKLNSNGDIEWEHFQNAAGNTVSSFLVQSSDGGYVFAGPYKSISEDNFPHDNFYIFKINAQGESVWTRDYGLPELEERAISLVETPDNGFAILGIGDGVALLKLDSNGILQWEKRYGTSGSFVYGSIQNTLDNGFIIASTTTDLIDFNRNAYLIKTDSLGNSITNQIQGNVWQDTQEDCIQTEEETTLEGWIVQAKKEDRIFYATTDSLGNYDITVDTGNYIVNVVRPNTYWEACEDSITFSFTEFFDTTQIDYPMLAVVDCSLLEIDISTPFLRRCFESNYYIQYCNKGTILAEDAYITVAFDEYLTINSTSIPPSDVENNSYTFQVGDVAVGECGTFEVNVTVDCDSTVLGQTHCVEAYIFPDSLCQPLDPNWDQANIEVDATCIGDSIQFTIKNTGIGDMGLQNDYIIVVDEFLLRNDSYDLNSSDTKTITEAANGETFRLQTSQTPGHPIGNMPSVTVEGCNAEDLDDIHIGFFNNFAEDDDGPFVSIDCQENIGSYDPNDKQASPEGIGESHFIAQNTDIEYKIRFQNTGTDTAFRVVVLDTISEFLEPTSIIPGASSHAYTFELYGYGVVKFTFDNILLVDSTTNEAASHGFVKFRIDQKEDNPLESIIQNSASIYFDFNAPIKTNTTFHTVGENVLSIISSTAEKPFENTQLAVFPNPFENTTTFQIEGIDNFEEIQLKLYDTTGRLFRTETHNTSTFTFNKKNLSSGIYFYTIETEKGKVMSGKLLVH